MSEPMPMSPTDAQRHLASIETTLRTALEANRKRTANISDMAMLDLLDYAEAYGGMRYVIAAVLLYFGLEARAKWDAEAAELEAMHQQWLTTPEGRTVFNWAQLIVGNTSEQYTAGEGNDHIGVPR